MGESSQPKESEWPIGERKTVGGVTGEHAHSVLNTFPEGMAVMINHAVNYFAKAA